MTEKIYYHLGVLEEIINKNKKSLERYVQKPQAISGIIEEKNKQILQMVELFNFLDNNYSDFGQNLVSSIKAILDKDPDVGTVLIRINFNEGNKHTSLISYDLSNGI